MEIVIPEGTSSTEGEEVKLSKKEHDEMVEALANSKQAEANMQKEVIELRKKNRESALAKSPEVKAEDVSKAIEAEFKKRESEESKKSSEQALIEFLDSHPEFAKENDEGGLKFAAFQKALGRFSLTGVKTKDEYTQVLNDALRLTGESGTVTPNYSSTPRSVPEVRGVSKGAQLTTPEQKVVQKNFGGDIEAYLKVKAKRPEYMEEILKYVRV